MDCLHYRFETERDYCQRLSKLQPPPQGYVHLSTNLLCLSTPWVTGAWRNDLPLSGQVKHPYPISGDLPNPDNANFALDSAYALWASTTRWGTGNPGRLLQEIRKEARVAHSFRRLVPWQQVEFHSLSPEARADLYVPTPTWWFGDGWTSSHMFVALPPLVTYRASRLLQQTDLKEEETEYWWKVFEASGQAPSR